MKFRGASILEARHGLAAQGKCRRCDQVLVWADCPSMPVDDDALRFLHLDTLPADLVVPSRCKPDDLDVAILNHMTAMVIADRYTDRIEALCQRMTFSNVAYLTAVMMDTADFIEYVRGGIRV